MIKQAGNVFVPSGETYVDLETTGLDDNREIITFQVMSLGDFGDGPRGPLVVYKAWAIGERAIIKIARRILLPEDRWTCVPVGVHLKFDFDTLDHRSRFHGLGAFDMEDRLVMDLKVSLILANGGNPRGYNLPIDNGMKWRGSDIPKFYRENRYNDILQYVNEESKNTVKIYDSLRFYLERWPK